MKEAFNIGWDLPADHPEVVGANHFAVITCGRMPGRFPTFARPRSRILMLYHRLGMRLHRTLANDLGVSEDFFDDKLDQPLATLRLLHYPAPEAI